MTLKITKRNVGGPPTITLSNRGIFPARNGNKGSSSLSESEQERLVQLEKIIKAADKVGLAKARALYEIDQHRLFRGHGNSMAR